jgi:hypothetical protein
MAGALGTSQHNLHLSNSAAKVGHLPATSVVDLAIISDVLFPAVRDFHVKPHSPDWSADHCALSLTVNLPDHATTHRLRARAPRAFRPAHPAQIQAFCDALQDHSQQLCAIHGRLQEGSLSAMGALTAVHNVLMDCVAQARRTSAADGHADARRARSAGAPWFSDELQALKAERARLWRVHLDNPSSPALHTLALTARKRYMHACKRARHAHRQETQLRHLSVFFGRRQRDFWRVFLGKGKGTGAPCVIADVSQWTAWFKDLLQPPPAIGAAALDPDLFRLQARLASVAPRGDFSALNDPVTLTELLHVVRSLPNGRAADAHGLTCELLKLAACPRVSSVDADVRGEDADPPLCCPALLHCMLHIINNMHTMPALPHVLAVSKLTPVPKASQRTAPLDMHKYRGITVGSVYSKVIDRLLHRRLDAAVEAQGLRSPTQCGFRKGKGTLDATFALHHLIAKARHDKTCLYVLFVDFRKAFDNVKRETLLQRCAQLGISGEFLQVMRLLYSDVQQQVFVNGRLGELFRTYRGTKQGSELSPLLFGLFMDILGELLRMDLPGAGPAIGNMRVPDLGYADDEALLSMTDPYVLQQMLACLDLFCAMFDMDLNFDGLDKTCVVPFHGTETTCQRITLRFRGVTVPWADKYKHLGVVFHSTKDLKIATKMLADSERRAMHALLGKCREQRITQFDFKCRMFDTLVSPIMSYGCQVWGPEVFEPILRCMARPTQADVEVTLPIGGIPGEEVHLDFLRIMAGVGSSCSLDVLLRDFQRTPMLFHWVTLAARWFVRVATDTSVDSLSHNVLLDDLRLAVVDGCTRCWSFSFLKTMQHLNLLRAGEWDAGVDTILAVANDPERFTEKHITWALLRCLRLRWNGLAMHPRDPATPSARFDRCVFAAWVWPLPDEGPLYGTRPPPHLSVCESFRTLQCLAKLRLGWHDLQIRVGRWHPAQQHARQSRLCPLCSTASAPFSAARDHRALASGVEDMLHFLLDCPAYTHIRSCFSDVFPIARTDDDSGMMIALFNHNNQARLAKGVLLMTEFRRQCMLAIEGGSLQPAMSDDAIATHTTRLQHLVHRTDHILPQLPDDLY